MSREKMDTLVSELTNKLEAKGFEVKGPVGAMGGRVCTVGTATLNFRVYSNGRISIRAYGYTFNEDTVDAILALVFPRKPVETYHKLHGALVRAETEILFDRCFPDVENGPVGIINTPERTYIVRSDGYILDLRLGDDVNTPHSDFLSFEELVAKYPNLKFC